MLKPGLFLVRQTTFRVFKLGVYSFYGTKVTVGFLLTFKKPHFKK